ncbi:glucokinase [Glacieibacterium frigidum]|nr:glucokinase [Glacieibacterium frigidum]
MQIVAADIGGTHARFALAEIDGGRVVDMAPPVVMKAVEHASLQTAWEAFADAVGHPLPRAAAIAVACPVQGEVLKLTNNPWIIRPALIGEKLGVDRFILCNDFTAVGHAVAHVGADALTHLCGPDVPLPATGVTSIVGPGTGLGVAQLVRGTGPYQVLPTEGGHIDFAPLDGIEDAILQRLRKRFRRVSVERIVAGPGLVDIHDALAALEGRTTAPADDKALWAAALAGEDSLAAAALDRFCLSLGSVAGDIALTQGANGLVIAGGLGLRLAAHLPKSGFRQRFVAKGRFEGMMAAIPVKLLTHPQPGLFGAAAAFAQEHGGS